MDLVVMRLANMRRVHPRQDNTRVCAMCGEQVGIYPSGQAMLRHDPTTRIICNVCYERNGPADIEMLASGAETEPFESKPLWQPIETAPKGEELLLYFPGHKYLPPMMKVDRLGNAPRKPTHWMPLPEPPSL